MTEEVALSIMGKEIKYEPRTMGISQISFYEKNPRIATIVSEHKGKVTDEIIDECLWSRDETHKLKRSIEEDGGLINPIWVYNGKVLEGNTRLCCYRHLYAENMTPRWKSIKCNVILDALSQEEIYRLLCTEHITGKIDWDPYDKANLYCKMKGEDGLSLEKIAEIVGDSTATISYKMRAYKLMVANGVIDKKMYSHFEQLVMNEEIREIKRTQEPNIEQKVIERIKDGTVRKATDIRSIGTIWKHKEARKRVFQLGEDVEQVYHDVKATAPMTDSPIIREVEDLVRRVRSLTREERDAIKHNNRDCSKIEQLTTDLLDLCREMGITICLPKKMQKGKQ
jgi:hypothetical protein